MPTHPLLAMARTIGNPVIGGETVTFIWQGKTAPRLIDDLHNWDEDPQTMQRAGTELWSYSMPLAADAYFEYAFLDPKTGERLPDPLNPNRIWNGINAYNHYFYMPRSGPTPLVQSIKGLARGTVTRHQVPTKEYVVDANRTVYLYQPPVKAPVPLVVVYDGPDYLKRTRLNVIVDNLIAAKRVRPFAMAMVQNGGSARSLEYSCSESTLGFVFECVISLAQEHLTLTPPGGEPYGVLGASLGGLMALYTGMRLPKVFGKVLSQSGAFLLPEHQFVVIDLVRYAPRPEIDIWMNAGHYERLLDSNRQMYALLKEKKYKVKYHEFSGGHNFTAWRDHIWRGLEALFR
ncbi:MAG: alpha/beta hydrolase-fold protein [Chloroflexi bacterium]|nr:alpha/beta hydrolase-fold protein [Chloroflexota bacterium]